MEREYKDSGIEWIGLIPKEWNKDKVNRIFSTIGSGTTPSSSDEKAYEGTLNWIQSGDINGGDLLDVKNKISETTLQKYSALTMYYAPFIIIAMYGASVGNISISYINGCVNQACCVLADPIHCFKYQFYAIKSAKDYLIFKAVGGGQPNISQATLKQLWLPFPPLSEQQKISDYLDKVCGEADEMIALQEKMIEELKAYKQSVITEAVTKGLNPNVPMKDSGIDWIGEIPEHWLLERLKFMCIIQTGNQDTQDARQDGDYNFYVRSPKIERSTNYSFEGEGILMAGDGAGAGRVFHHVYGKYAVHQRVYRLSNFIRDINSCYLFQYISSLFVKIMDMGSAQSTVPSVRLPMLQNFVVCIPPIAEQQAISSYLDTKCSVIDSLIAVKQQKMEELKEYKKSVIYEYVTGKKEVI